MVQKRTILGSNKKTIFNKTNRECRGTFVEYKRNKKLMEDYYNIHESDSKNILKIEEINNEFEE
jgi:hypothetical protein